MKKSLTSLFFMLISASVFSQKDSTALTIEQFLEIVRQYHPVVKLSDITIKKSEADITIARGAFNPVLSTIVSNKTFNNITYFDYLNPNITLPVWYGVEINTGFENLSGNRFDPSETIGQSSYVGMSIPLLKNFVIDKRRAYLRQSKMYNEMAYTEKQTMINNVLMEAVTQFWDWTNAYKTYEIVQKNLNVSQRRFNLVKRTFFNGERPAIDTIEAMTQFQNFEFQKNESWLNFQNESLKLSAFLWQEGNNAFQLPEYIIPQNDRDIETDIQNFQLNLSELLANAQQFHPELQLYKQKLDVLQIDKKLKFQELLPKLDFKYNHLNKGYNAFAGNGLLFQNNYQYGLKLEMPLLFSQGRGEFKKAKLKLEETEIVRRQKALSINLKVKSYYNEIVTLRNQIELQQTIIVNYMKMLNAEEILFKNGESSLFLINSRENKLLETERKLIELKTKYFKAVYALKWSTGLLR